MMGYVQTTQDIIDWYMKNPNANANLITAFRSAVTTSIASPSTTSAQQNNSGSMQTNSAQTMNSYMSTQNTNTEAANNNTGDNNNNNTNNNEQSNVDTGSTANASNSYNEPLGEIQGTEATDNSPDNWSLGVAAVVTSVAVATGAAYALSKKSNEQDES